MAKLRLTHFFRAEYRLAKFSAGNTADLVLKFFTSGKFRVGAAALYWLDASYNKLKNFFTKMHYLCIKFRQILGGEGCNLCSNHTLYPYPSAPILKFWIHH